jgi:hypothetical protein
MGLREGASLQEVEAQLGAMRDQLERSEVEVQGVRERGGVMEGVSRVGMGCAAST